MMKRTQEQVERSKQRRNAALPMPAVSPVSQPTFTPAKAAPSKDLEARVQAEVTNGRRDVDGIRASYSIYNGNSVPVTVDFSPEATLSNGETGLGGGSFGTFFNPDSVTPAPQSRGTGSIGLNLDARKVPFVQSVTINVSQVTPAN